MVTLMTSHDAPDQPPASALPLSLTTFVGRLGELDRLVALVDDPAIRLITLHGPAGVGKTRLAEELGRRVDHRYSQVALADLTQVEVPELLPRVVAEALQLRDLSSRPGRQALLDHLSERTNAPILLILDNAEHLSGAVTDLVVAVLRTTLAVTIVVTSQDMLGVPGERVFEVTPLASGVDGVDGHEDGALTAKDGSEWDAVALLVDRIRDTSDGFVVTNENRGGLVRLCRALDGLPLAIELAARWLRMLSPEDLLARLDLLDQATGSAAGRRTSHQSLAAAVQTTYALCTPAQRAVWARLGVFVGSFDLSAATAIAECEEVPAEQVLAVLEQLDARSVIVGVEPSRHLRIEPRWRLLDTARRHARRLAEDEGIANELRLRHARYYCEQIDWITTLYRTPREVEGYRWINERLSQIRAALAFACSDGPADLALELAVGLARAYAWFFLGSLSEGRAWLARATARTTDPHPTVVVARASQAFLAACQGDHPAAQQYVAEGCALLNGCDPQLPETSVAAAALRQAHGGYLWLTGDPDSVAVLSEAADLWGSLDLAPQRWFARLLMVLAGAAYAPDGDRMVRIAYDLIEEIEPSRPPSLWGWAQIVAGLCELLHGSPQRAVEQLRMSLRGHLSVQDRWGPMWSALILADATARVGDFDSTEDLLHAAASLRHQTGIALQAMVPLSRHANNAEQLLHAAGRSESLDQRRALTNDRTAAEDIIVCVVGALEPAAVPDIEEQTAGLTGRQREVAELVATGMTSAEVADELSVARRTVENHLAAVYRRLGINNRAALPAMLAELDRRQERGADANPLRRLR